MSKVEVFAARYEYIAPDDCESSVGYKILAEKGLSASMDLADCNRKITWYFSTFDGKDPLQKIDKILEIMTAFRDDLLAARKKYARSKKTGGRK